MVSQVSHYLLFRVNNRAKITSASVGYTRRHHNNAGGWVSVPIHVSDHPLRGNCFAIVELGGHGATSNDEADVRATATFMANAFDDLPRLVRALQRVVEDVARQKAIKDLAISVGQEHDDACTLDFILEHIPSIITEELGK